MGKKRRRTLLEVFGYGERVLTWQRSVYDYKNADEIRVTCDREPYLSKPEWKFLIKGCSEHLWQTVQIELTQEQLEQVHFGLGVALLEAAMDKDENNE